MMERICETGIARPRGGKLIRLILALSCLTTCIAVTGCGSVDTSKADVANLTNVVQARDAEIANLNAEIADLNAERAAKVELPEPRVQPREESVAVVPKPRQAKCYKDYCPCDLPQGGPDSILCDQIEQGIEVDVQMMIAGRGMREARRQMATGNF